MISTIIIIVSGALSTLSFLRVVSKKEDLENQRRKITEEQKRREETLDNASKLGVAAGVAGVAAGSYYFYKNHKGQTIKKPITNNIKKPDSNLFNKTKKKKFTDLFKKKRKKKKKFFIF